MNNAYKGGSKVGSVFHIKNRFSHDHSVFYLHYKHKYWVRKKNEKERKKIGYTQTLSEMA